MVEELIERSCRDYISKLPASRAPHVTCLELLQLSSAYFAFVFLFSTRQRLSSCNLFCFPDKYSIPHPARCRRRKSLYVQPPLAALGWRLTFSSPLPASPWLRPTALVLSRRPQRVLWTLTMNPRTPGTRLRQQQPQPQHRLLNRPLLRLRRLPRQSPRDP